MSAQLARAVLEGCRKRGAMLATAESCTGGMVAACLTDLAGASQVLDRGFITYSNAAKTEMLGVSAQTLAAHGAVSDQTALEMAGGALARSNADLAISITGIAGPDGGSPEKPVGLVWFGFGERGKPVRIHKKVFAGMDRAQIRRASVETALRLLHDALHAGGD